MGRNSYRRSRSRSPRRRRHRSHTPEPKVKGRGAFSRTGLRAWDPREFPSKRQRSKRPEKGFSDDWIEKELRELEDKGSSVQEIAPKTNLRGVPEWKHDRFDWISREHESKSRPYRASPTYDNQNLYFQQIIKMDDWESNTSASSNESDHVWRFQLDIKPRKTSKKLQDGKFLQADQLKQSIRQLEFSNARLKAENEVLKGQIGFCRDLLRDQREKKGMMGNQGKATVYSIVVIAIAACMSQTDCTQVISDGRVLLSKEDPSGTWRMFAILMLGIGVFILMSVRPRVKDMLPL